MAASTPLFRDGGPVYVGYGRTLRKVRIIADTPPFVSYVERRKLAVLLSWVGTDKEPMLYGRVWRLPPNQAALDAVIFHKRTDGGPPTVTGVQLKTRTQAEKEGKALGFNEFAKLVNKVSAACDDWEAWKPHFAFLVTVRRRKSSRFVQDAG
eukprot:contig_1120_g144